MTHSTHTQPGRPDDAFPFVQAPLRRAGRLAYDYDSQLALAGVAVDDNPFRHAPRAYEPGFERDAFSALTAAIGEGKSVLVSGAHGIGKGRLSDEFYGWCHRSPAEHFITNAVQWSLEKVRGYEARDAVNTLATAALAVIAHMEMPTDTARRAHDAIPMFRAGNRADAARRSAEELMDLIATIGREAKRSLVIRLEHAEALGRKQLDLIAETVGLCSSRGLPVQFIISGLPGAIESIRSALPNRSACAEVQIDWQIEREARVDAARQVVAMTAASAVPFTADAAHTLINSSDGMRSLMYEIGAAAWDHARTNGCTEVSRGTVAMVTPGVLAAMSRKYEQALQAYESGDPSARYVRALHDLTAETGDLLHDHDAVVARAGLSAAEHASIDRAALRRDGWTMRSSDGRIGLADPQLGALVSKLAPGAIERLV